MSLFTNKYIAHRGLHNGKFIPENSLLAFKKAIEKNYAIEFDITITKDNQVVVFHDEDLFRLCNKKEKVEEVEYGFLKKLKLYNSDEDIPLFKEVLELVDEKIALIIEIKKHQNIGVLENIVLALLEKYKGEYFICSFEKDILFWLKENRTNIKRGLIFEYNPKVFEKYNKALFFYKYYKVKPDFVSLDYRLLNSSIYKFCKKNSLPIFCWTIDSKELGDKFYNKVDGLIFEKFIP